MEAGQEVRYTGPNTRRAGAVGQVLMPSDVYPGSAWVSFPNEKAQLIKREHLQLVPAIEKEAAHHG